MLFVGIVIIVFEVIRLVLYFQDSKKVRKTNAAALRHQMRALEDWKSLRKAEIEELKLLAKESDTMREIYVEYMERHQGEAKND